jgi:hypothetical protein
MTVSQPLDVTKYPFIFYPVGLNLQGRKCVVIGAADDKEAIEKDASRGRRGRCVDHGLGALPR